MSGLGGEKVTSSFNQSAASNWTTVDGLTSCNQDDNPAYFFFMVVYSVVFLVGLILNGFTLKVYFCQTQQQAPSSVTIYLKNLAAADFLVSLSLPIRIAHYASNSISVHRVYCNFGASAFYLNMYASILFMGYIAANRYLKIVHPLGTHILQKVRSAHIISTATWIFLLTTTIIYITLSLLTQEALASVPDTRSCQDLQSKQLRLYYKIAHSCSAVIFLLVLGSLVFFYYSTSRRLSLALQKQPASSGSKKLAKSRRNMLVLVSVFCVCFIPYHLIRLPYMFLSRWSKAFFYLKELTIMMSILNVCLDPLIYFIFCKAFRAQLSLRRVFSTTQGATLGANPARRSSDGRLSTMKVSSNTMLQHDDKGDRHAVG